MTRPQRRTALIAQELAHYNVEIRALSGTHIMDEGSICELEEGYTFFWKEETENEDRVHGVGLAVCQKHFYHISECLTGINEFLMKLHFATSKNRYTTVISAHALTVSVCDKVKKTFYKNLEYIIRLMLQEDKLILLGNFSVSVGTAYVNWGHMLGQTWCE